MKLNRSLMITILIVVFALGTGIILNGCASIGKGKEAGAEMESSQQIGQQSTAVEQTSGSSPGGQKEPLVNAGGSGENPYIQEASLKGGEVRFGHYATSLKQALERVLPETLPEMNWDRITTVLGGIVALALIYGLAFALARLPLRRRGAGRRGSRQTVEQAGASISQ